jgi:DNA-binding LacI/PurR family transcriptional regulator
VNNPFFPAAVRGAEDVAFSNGYRLMLCNTDNDHSKELVHLNELRTYLPAGLLVIPSNFSDLTAQAKSYREAGTAVVCVDRLPDDGMATVRLSRMKKAPIRPADTRSSLVTGASPPSAALCI